MAASYEKFNDFVQDIGTGVHNLSSGQIVVALTAAANAPASTDGQLSDLTEISYANLSSRNVTTTSFTNTTGTSKLILADLVLTASGSVEAFRYIVLYNDDATNNELIGFYDFGSEITMADTDTFTLDFSAGDGVLTIV